MRLARSTDPEAASALVLQNNLPQRCFLTGFQPRRQPVKHATGNAGSQHPTEAAMWQTPDFRPLPRLPEFLGLLSAGMKSGPLRNSRASISFELPLRIFGQAGASRRLEGHTSQ
jgi:hypothetical protein